MNNESFVMYESVYKQAQILEKRLGKEVSYDFLKAVTEFGLYGVLPDEDSAVWLYGFEQTITSISRAKDRYTAAIENGKKGGRPQIQLKKEEVMSKKKELGTWKAVAAYYGITEQTLKNKRTEWEENEKNPKNLNDNVNENINKKENVNANTNANGNAAAVRHIDSFTSGVELQAFKAAGGVVIWDEEDE